MQDKRKGFTILELVISAAIGAVIVALTSVMLLNTRNANDLKSTTQEVTTLLREAQSRSISQASNTTWGVHFDNNTTTPFFALFYGSSYTASKTIQQNRLPSTICYSTLNRGSSTDIVFSQIVGIPSATTSIGFQTVDGCTGGLISNGINRSSSGMIFFDSFNRPSL